MNSERVRPASSALPLSASIRSGWTRSTRRSDRFASGSPGRRPRLLSSESFGFLGIDSPNFRYLMLSRQIMATRPAYSDSEDSRAHLEALRFLTGLAKDRAESVAGGSSMDLSHIRHLLAFDRWDRAFAWLRAKSVGRGADADVQAL